MSCGKISMPAAVPAIDKPTAENIEFQIRIYLKELNFLILFSPYLGHAYAWNSDLMQRMQHLWRAPPPSL